MFRQMVTMDQPLIFDRALLARRRRRAVRRPAPGADFLVKAVAGDLAERLGAVTRDFDVAVDLGGVTGDVAEMLCRSGKAATVIRADGLCRGPGAAGPDLVVDDECLPFRHRTLDLVVSALSLQFINDLPGTLVQIRQSLKPDGLFLAAFAGGDTLTELRAALVDAETEILGGVSPRVMPAITVRDMGALLQRAGFALPVADRDRLVVRYDTMFDLMRDLRDMGAANPLIARRRVPTPRRLLLRAADIYAERFSDPDGRIRATFEIISVSGWAPHESQQKPLRPGSARMRLADALETDTGATV